MSNLKYKKNNWGRDAVILCAITLVAGLLLGFVYQLTKEPIKEANRNAKNKAYALVVPNGIDFNDELNAHIKNEDYEGVTLEEARAAKDETGQVIGYAVMATTSEGYITLIVGTDTEGEVLGVEVLSMSETPGLGANCTTEDFRNQYIGKKSEIELKKKDAKTDENEVNAITSATITSKAITKTINAALSFIKTLQ